MLSRGMLRLRWRPAWTQGYRRSWLLRDLLAGALGAIASIPAAMGLAEVAGLPPRYGLFVLILPVLVYAVVGTSRRMVIAPTGAVAALIGGSILPLAEQGYGQPYQLASTLALMVGALLLLSSVLKLGVLESFVSRPVLDGYLAGAAVVVALSQLGPLFGARSEGKTAVVALRQLLESLDMITPGRVVFGVGALGALVALRGIRLPLPAPALLLVGATLVAGLLDAAGVPLDRIGPVGRGLPPFGVPVADLRAVQALLPSALAICLIIVSISQNTARAAATGRGERVLPNRELAALGLTNLAASMSGGFPVGGSEADTAFGERSGARTPLAAVASGGVVLLVLMHGSLFRRIPIAAVSAVVLVAVLEAVAWRTPKLLWRFDRREFAFLLVAFLGVLLVGVVPGIVVAVAANVAVLMLSAVRARLVELGQVAGSREAFADRERNPELRPVPGVLLLRVDAPLFFINAASLTDEVVARWERASPSPRAVALDLGPVFMIDFTGCEALESLERTLGHRGARLVLATPPGRVRAGLRRYGLQKLLPAGAGPTGLRQALDQLGVSD